MKICFDAHRADGRVWCVQVGRRWLNARVVMIAVPFRTVYKGRTSRQPKAWIEPIEAAKVVRKRDALHVVAA